MDDTILTKREERLLEMGLREFEEGKTMSLREFDEERRRMEKRDRKKRN